MSDIQYVQYECKQSMCDGGACVCVSDECEEAALEHGGQMRSVIVESLPPLLSKRTK